MRHVLIIGLPGVGKSKLLDLCRTQIPEILYFDLDRELEARLGLVEHGLTEWILSRPEGMDRQFELATLLDLLKSNTRKMAMISLGGGALDLFIQQQRYLAELGDVRWIYLESDLECILDQLMQDGTRPHAKLGSREHWRALFQKRINYFVNLPGVYRCQLKGFDFKFLRQMLQSEK